MTSPGNYDSIVSRGDTAARTPEQVSGSMGSSRRGAATRGSVRGDGSVHVGGKHVGHVYKAGIAWRARTKGGQQIGLHTTKQEAVGALVRHHEGSC